MRMTPGFMYATGIENSCPTIDGGRTRMDELEFCRHYDLRRRDIIPITDLCHFGVPDWLGNFQNPDFPELFAGYAAAFARRYPWVQLYTPVNEMFICAIFS